MEIYFDNAATTKPTDEVVNVVAKTMISEYGNPSSAHIKGMEAENVLSSARKDLAKLISSKEDEIIFTSGGTESNNLALSGFAYRNRRSGNKIMLSPIEHPSMLSQVELLKAHGFEIFFTPLDKNGLVDLEELEKMIDEEFILLSVMYVNNEIGIKQSITEISRVAKAKNPNIVVHSDMVQAFGKLKINVKELGIDMLSISGHKFHGPRGVGALYVKKGVKLESLVKGSSQQYGLRAGTENVPGIAGMVEAAKQVYNDFSAKQEKFRKLKDSLLARLEKIDEVFFYVDTEVCVDHIVSFGIENIRSEVMLHALEDKGVYVSNGAACSSKKKKKKGTLSVLGVEDNKRETAIRVSFNSNNTVEEINYFADELEKQIKILKRYVRK